MDEKQEIQSLRRELEQANYEYYVLDNPSMSDYDFDHKLRRLEELEAAHPELVTPDSPTQRVGGKVADGFQEVRHRIPLESLQDVFSVEELEEFDQRMRRLCRRALNTTWSPRWTAYLWRWSMKTASLCAAPPAAMARWERM